jgi:hypothetical protein
MNDPFSHAASRVLARSGHLAARLVEASAFMEEWFWFWETGGR